MSDRASKIAEYVDSPSMFYRVRFGTRLSCSIDGNFGRYRTESDLNGRRAFSCSCPSDYAPCKHVEALRETHRKNPSSFIDVDHIFKGLERKTKGELMTLMHEMALHAPSSLTALGVPGFAPRGVDEHETDDDYESDER